MGGLADFTSIVAAGRNFYVEVMEAEKSKVEVTHSDIKTRLNANLLTFIERANIKHDFSISFGDVHHQMGLSWHTELAFVEISRDVCRINFHDRLIDFKAVNTGFVFIAKIWVLVLVLDRLMSGHPDMSTSFVFEVGDGGSLNQVAYTSHHPDAAVIIDYDFASSNGYDSFRKRCAEVPSWESRKDVLFWRGSTTGARLFNPPSRGIEDNLDWLQRLRACRIISSSVHGDAADVGISRIVQMGEEYLTRRIRQSGLMKQGVPREYFLEYKYVLDIDGNANAWSGLFCSLLGGNCVMKVASPHSHRQWYYDRLHPWREYIPIAADLSDFEERYAWCREHPRHCEEIAGRGRELAMAIDMEQAMKSSVAIIEAWIGTKNVGNIAHKR